MPSKLTILDNALLAKKDAPDRFLLLGTGALQMLFEEAIHVDDHLVEPGQLVPTTVLAVGIDFQARPDAVRFEFLA